MTRISARGGDCAGERLERTGKLRRTVASAHGGRDPQPPYVIPSAACMTGARLPWRHPADPAGDKARRVGQSGGKHRREHEQGLDHAGA